MEHRASTPFRRTGAVLGALALVASAAPATAQERTPPRPNLVYAEMGGNTLLGANYERQMSPHASLRVGMGLVPIVGAVTFVCMPNLVTGSRHQLEGGAGLVGATYRQVDRGAYVRPAAATGYRFRADNGFFFRASLGLTVDHRLWVTPGVSFGMRF